MSVIWQIAISVASGVIVAVVVSFAVFRIRFEALKATSAEREKHRIETQRNTEARLNSHSERILKNADHEARIKSLERELKTVRDNYHNFRRQEIENVYALFRRWKDEMTELFVRKK